MKCLCCGTSQDLHAWLIGCSYAQGPELETYLLARALEFILNFLWGVCVFHGHFKFSSLTVFSECFYGVSRASIPLKHKGTVRQMTHPGSPSELQTKVRVESDHWGQSTRLFCFLLPTKKKCFSRFNNKIWPKSSSIILHGQGIEHLT